MAKHVMYCEFCEQEATHFFIDKKELPTTGGYKDFDIEGETHVRCEYHARPDITFRLDGAIEFDYPGREGDENYVEVITPPNHKENITKQGSAVLQVLRRMGVVC